MTTRSRARSVKNPAPTSMFLPTPVVAAELGVTTQTVRNMVARGELPAIRIGNRLRIHRLGYEEYLKRVGATDLNFGNWSENLSAGKESA